MDIRKENCVAAFEALGLKHAVSYFGDFSQHGIFAAIERGDITPGDFHDALHRLLPAEVTDAQIDQAFCKFLIGIPEHRLAELERLGQHYNLCLLSNTNPIMWTSTIKEEFEKCGRNIEDYFPGGIVTSFEANALKPEAKIFEFAIAKLGIKPTETLFLDDSQANLDGAATLGFHTALVPTDTEFDTVVRRVLGEASL